MKGIARLGDQCGGYIISSAVQTFVDNLPVARLGDSITPHGEGLHARAVLVTASAGFFAENIPVCRLGDSANCGHQITSASFDAFNDE